MYFLCPARVTSAVDFVTETTDASLGPAGSLATRTTTPATALTRSSWPLGGCAMVSLPSRVV